jgi:hypothetical protein
MSYSIHVTPTNNSKKRQNDVLFNVTDIINEYIGHITNTNINDFECPNDNNYYMIMTKYENTIDNVKKELVNFIIDNDNIHIVDNDNDYHIIIKAMEQYNVSNMMTSRVRISTYLRNCIGIASFLSVLKDVNNIDYNIFLSKDEESQTENILIIEMINLISNKNRFNDARNKEWKLFPYLVNILNRIGTVGIYELKNYFDSIFENCNDYDTKLQMLITAYCNKINSVEIVVNNKYFMEIYNFRMEKNNKVLNIVSTITNRNFDLIM